MTAYLMYLDEDGGHSCTRAMETLKKQRPSIDIGGGSAEMVGGNGQGLVDALQLWEWCLVAQEAAGRQDLPTPEGEPPFSPTLKANEEGSPGAKRKSPFLSGQDNDCNENPESPGKRVRGVAAELDNFKLC